MEKYRKKLTIICFLLAGLFIALGTFNYIQSQKKFQTFKLGVLLYRDDDAFISMIANDMEHQKSNFKKQFGQDLSLTFKAAKQNQTLQNQQLDFMLQNDYDAIAVNLVDRTVAAGIVEKIKQAGIPVVFFNREPVEADLKRWSKAYYVGSSARESGEKQAQIIVDAWKKAPQQLDKNGDGVLQYVLIEGEEVHQDSLIRTESSIQYLTEAGLSLQRLHRGAADWMRQPAYELMKDWLQTDPNQIELVISNNDEMALGALNALGEANVAPLPAIVGIDGTKSAREAVDGGKMLGTVINSSSEQAKAILELAASSSMSQNLSSQVPDLEGRYIWVPYKIYTKP